MLSDDLTLPVLKAVLVANSIRSDLMFGQLKAMLPRKFRARRGEKLVAALEELTSLGILQQLSDVPVTEPCLVYKAGETNSSARDLHVCAAPRVPSSHI